MTAWRSILEVATRTPSPHNVQPWRVRLLDDRCAELYLEKARTLPREDETGSFLILTMGLFVEAVRLVAAHQGLGVDEEDVQPFGSFTSQAIESRSEPLLYFCRLVLRPSSDVTAPYAIELFERRRTSRLSYAPDPVPDADARDLDRLASQWGQRYAQTHDRARIERLLAWNIDAVFADLNTDDYRGEMAEWIRYGNGSSRAHRDGLDARCMNQSPIELWLAFHAPALLRVPYFRARYRRQIGPVATMGVLAGGFWNPEDAYRAGRFLLHFWLEVTRRGWYFHPYGNLVTNQLAARRCEKEWGVPDIWLEFKIGRSAEPPRSHRRSVEEILV